MAGIPKIYNRVLVAIIDRFLLFVLPISFIRYSIKVYFILNWSYICSNYRYVSQTIKGVGQRKYFTMVILHFMMRTDKNVILKQQSQIAYAALPWFLA